MRSEMLIGFHAFIRGRDWEQAGAVIIFRLVLLGGLVSYICIVCFLLCFMYLWWFLFICPYIHPKFPSIISDDRGYLGTKRIYGQSGVLFSVVLLLLRVWFFMLLDVQW